MRAAARPAFSGTWKPEAPCVAPEPFGRFNLLGDSPAFRAALGVIERYARCGETVLIEGETGTGKELAARAIHYLGTRRDTPFVPVNCGAVPDSLVESEFFGHVRGAFTGAAESRQGLVAQAQGGTLFLDEIEALSPRAQVALLRFLQDREYRPVGGPVVRGADVRIVAATNVALAELCASGQYRKDLMFRLGVLRLALPPLRSRGDDVVTIAHALLERYCRQHGLAPKSLPAAALRALRAHPWPGNVRELESVLLRACLLDDGPELVLPELDAADGAAAAPESAGPEEAAPDELIELSFREAKARAVASFERRYVEALLRRTGGNVSEAARVAGKERSRLARLIRKHGLCVATFRAQPPHGAPRTALP